MFSLTKTQYEEVWTKNKQIHRWTNDLQPAKITTHSKQYFLHNNEYQKVDDHLIGKETNYIKLVYENKGIFTFLNEKTTKIVRENKTIEFCGILPYSWKESDKIILHNYPGPAVIYNNGDEEYWIQGIRHRDDGPAVIIGNKHYYFRCGEFIKFEINPSNIS